MKRRIRNRYLRSGAGPRSRGRGTHLEFTRQQLRRGWGIQNSMWPYQRCIERVEHSIRFGRISDRDGNGMEISDLGTDWQVDGADDLDACLLFKSQSELKSGDYRTGDDVIELKLCLRWVKLGSFVSAYQLEQLRPRREYITLSRIVKERLRGHLPVYLHS